MSHEFTDQELEYLAAWYHERECRLNHTDACGWYYENADTYPPTAQRWSHDSWKRRVPELVKRDRERAAELERFIRLVRR